MASRKEQKEQARARRLAEEQARAERTRRQRRLQMLGGVALAAIAVVAVVIAISSGGGSSKNTSAPTHPAANGVTLPAQKIANLTAAAKAAGCVIKDTPDSIARTAQNRTHVDTGTRVPYATNPPSYGPHYPTPASDGEYQPGHVPAVGNLVHAMEHGRIEYQYSP